MSRDAVIGHYADRSLDLIQAMATAPAREYVELLRALRLLQRATDAEIYDPQVLDAPDWLSRLDA